MFAGSADHVPPVYLEAAWQLGETIARQERVLVYGAGKTGLMGALADGALSAGGRVTGVINDGLNLPQLVHAGLTLLETSRDIQARQLRMNQLADGIIALPGGFGTFDELFEALTWAQIGLHVKPIGVLNINHYFDPLLAMIEQAITEKFIFPEHRNLFRVSNEPAELLALLDAFTPPQNMHLWLER